ncbi:MAG: hypothetical protein IJK95_01435 [Firmicutes bacterium]|nr:hypothetical protein [Bacillota bacterium]
MENKSFTTSTKFKFILFSLLGIIIFFIKVNFRGSSQVPMLQVINLIKGAVPATANMWLVMLLCLFTLVTGLWAKSASAPEWLKKRHAKDGIFSYFTYITAAIFSVMVVFNVGPQFIIDPVVGTSSVNVARDVVYAVIIAGTLVVFLTEFGLLEFIGTLLEPVMRKLFKVPGKASIDALSSFVCSPAVGVMITNNLYKTNVYTQREAVDITTSFSICSLGAFAFLSGMANCSDYYSQLVLWSLILVFIMAAIMVRIPPISRKKDVYYDGTVQTEEVRKGEKYEGNIFARAWEAGLTKAQSATPQSVLNGLISSVGFSAKVAAYVVSLSVIFLALANYTPVVSWIGVPVLPILKVLGMPDAELIAPSVLSGFFALSLPSTLLKGTAVAARAGFFVVLLSTSQIIFFTESANAMLDSEIPVNFKDLLIIFLERTVFLIPLCVLISGIVLGF